MVTEAVQSTTAPCEQLALQRSRSRRSEQPVDPSAAKHQGVLSLRWLQVDSQFPMGPTAWLA